VTLPLVTEANLRKPQATAPKKVKVRAKPSLDGKAFTEVEGSPLLLALQRGSIRLVRGQYFERCLAEGRPFGLRQEMSDADLWPPEKAARMWTTYRSVFFLAMSYSWLGRSHPDPDLWHLKRFARIIREWRQSVPVLLERLLPREARDLEPLHDVGVFVDAASLYHPARDQLNKEQESQYQAGMEVVHAVYGHRHTTVMRCTGVPTRVPRKYRLRGWTGFEWCLSENKVAPDDKLYTFDDSFEPELESTLKASFFRKRKGPVSVPCPAERFEELLRQAEQEVKSLSAPHDKLFMESKDRPFILDKYREAWEHQRHSRELHFADAGWGDDEVEQLASLLPSLPNLEELHLVGNRVGDAGARALFQGLTDTLVKNIDLSNNEIGGASSKAMAEAIGVATELVSLCVIDNPICKDEAGLWELRAAWRAAGKDPDALLIDGASLLRKE